MIHKADYLNAKNIVEQYEAQQFRLAKFTGKSKCPFCGGTKTKPFVGNYSQDCKNCDKNGMMSNRKLAEMGIDECIEK
jgi:hypothetical protein